MCLTERPSVKTSSGRSSSELKAPQRTLRRLQVLCFKFRVPVRSSLMFSTRILSCKALKRIETHNVSSAGTMICLAVITLHLPLCEIRQRPEAIGKQYAINIHH